MSVDRNPFNAILNSLVKIGFLKEPSGPLPSWKDMGIGFVAVVVILGLLTAFAANVILNASFSKQPFQIIAAYGLIVLVALSFLLMMVMIGGTVIDKFRKR